MGWIELGMDMSKDRHNPHTKMELHQSINLFSNHDCYSLYCIRLNYSYPSYHLNNPSLITMVHYVRSMSLENLYCTLCWFRILSCVYFKHAEQKKREREGYEKMAKFRQTNERMQFFFLNECKIMYSARLLACVAHPIILTSII